MLFRVGMTCGGCEKAVRAVLNSTKGVQSVDIDLPSQQVEVLGTCSKEEVLSAIQKTGKTVVFLK